jgi:MinD-like ATPase involved in chromosome partitioning or flagellar assembly
MATITLLSAKGSPGVTTLAVALTLAWSAGSGGRRALLVDADPAGGDTAAGVLRGAVPVGAGMLALASVRGVPAGRAVAAASTALRADGAAQLIPGVPDAARAGALPLAWDRLNEARAALADQHVDLLVDAGRLEAQADVAWVEQADLVLLVVRPTLPAVTAAHRWVAARRPTAAGTGGQLALVVVESPAPYRADEVATAVGLPLQGVIPYDPTHAQVHAEGAPAGRAFARSAYARAIQQLAADAAAHVCEQGRPAASPIAASPAEVA